MGCSNCGKKGSPKCTLCGQSSKTFYPWGKRKICWRCEDKMKEKIEWHTREIDRITRKMEGHEWTRKDYDKRNKT